MSLPLIRADWAQHMIYGAWLGAAAQVAACAVALAMGDRSGMMLVPALGPLGALVGGLAKEGSDWLRNRRDRREWAKWAGLYGASTAGLQPYRHEVSPGDVMATVLGGLPPAVPLALWVWGSP